MSEQRTYLRFPLARRIEHVVMLLSFSLLAFTGLPQKFPTWGISQALVSLFGGIEMTRQIHHTAAVVLMLATIWHILVAGYKIFVDRTPLSMLPLLKDGKDAWQSFSYNVGLAKARPQMGRFTFEEKMEYWAFVWGVIVMGTTGFMMWNPISTLRFVPGEAVPAAKAAHGGEAVLAVLAIIIWHFYHVHLKHFNKSIFTGTLNREEMEDEHPAELAAMDAGEHLIPIPASVLRKRQMIYAPIAIAILAIFSYGFYFFIGYETTAVTTVPAGSVVQVYVPQTPTPLPTLPPTATAAPTKAPSATPASTTTEEAPAVPTSSTLSAAEAAVTWDSSVGPLFTQKCLMCHGSSASGGLNLSTYADAMKGGASGVVFTPGDSANNLMIVKFESGKHPYAVLSPEELALIKTWLDAGALEK